MVKGQHIMEIQGFQTPLAWVHLWWLEEWNLPFLIDLFHQDKLQSYLNEKVDKAEDNIELLMKEGRQRDQAEELVIYELLAPLRDDDPPTWSKKLLKLIPEIESSLKIDYSDQESSAEISEFDETKGSQDSKPSVGNIKDSLPKQKRVSWFKKHEKGITNNFKRLAELQKERDLRLKELSKEMDKEGIPLEDRPARFQQIYHEMVEPSDFSPYHVDKLLLWEERNKDQLNAKVNEVLLAKRKAKGITNLEAMRELKMELDEILNAEHETKEKSARLPREDSLLTETYQMKSLLELAMEKLIFLHNPPIKGQSVLGQLMLAVLTEEDEEDIYREVDNLTRHSDQQVQAMLYLRDQESLQDLMRDLQRAVTRDDLREVMIDDLLMSARIERQEPESQ